MAVYFSSDISTEAAPMPHFWEHTIGSGHATLGLRADWQQQLLRCHRELGFTYVRFHGILSDDMGTLMCESNQLVYSFFNADQVFDFLLNNGLKPFVELSFMPSALSSGPDTVFHYNANVTPPKDYAAWKELIKKLVSHWVERYGVENVREWFFEVWNEPNLSSFWKGSQDDYFLLYRYTAEAVKGVDNLLKVGGPATADNAWIAGFKKFCTDNKVPVDFISTHHYPTDAFGKPGDDTITQLADSRRSVLRDEIIETKKQAGGTPVYYTEWSTSSNPFDILHDQPYAAAFIIKTIMEGRGKVEGYSYWTFSDIFEENYFSSIPFHGGFGLLNAYGIPKPAYRAYELLHQLGQEILPVQGQHATVDAWVIKNKNMVQVLLTNSALPRHDVKTELIKFTLSNLQPVKNVSVQRVDDTHANAYALWIVMGKPGTLHPAQVGKLEAASALEKEAHLFKQENNSFFLEIELLPQATALITIEIE